MIINRQVLGSLRCTIFMWHNTTYQKHPVGQGPIYCVELFDFYGDIGNFYHSNPEIVVFSELTDHWVHDDFGNLVRVQ